MKESKYEAGRNIFFILPMGFSTYKSFYQDCNWENWFKMQTNKIPTCSQPIRALVQITWHAWRNLVYALQESFLFSISDLFYSINV